MTRCPVCGHDVPPGLFCGACGARLDTGSPRRLAHYAADPHEHVLAPNIVTTLFPHLPHHRTATFRVALAVIALLIIVLAAFRLIGPAIGVAALGVPVLYLIYLEEADLYHDEPIVVVGATFVLGLLLGIPWALWTGPIVTRTAIDSAALGQNWGKIAMAGVLLPILAQILMLVGPALLYLRGRYRAPLDGFAFGAASALGFTLATTIVNLEPQLHLGLVSRAPALTNLLAIVSRGLLIPFLNASTTGLIAAGLWLWRSGRDARTPGAWAAMLPLAIVVALLVRVVLGVLDVSLTSPWLVVAIDVVLSVALLLWVRFTVHQSLLGETPQPEVDGWVACTGCRRLVPNMGFCPDCGLAMAAAPHRGQTLESPPDLVEGHYPHAGSHALDRPGRSRLPLSWAAGASAAVLAMVVLGGLALARTPQQKAACRAFCPPPPPPCLVNCTHGLLEAAGPLRDRSTYTSSVYKFSLSYPSSYDPSRKDDRSIGWDLDSDAGQYSIDVVAGATKGDTPQQIADSLQRNNFSDYQGVYNIPGAEIGYTSGYGAVWENQVTPLFGASQDTRLAIEVSERGNLAIAVAGTGPATDPSRNDRPDPSGLAIGSFMDSVGNTVHWP